MRLYLAHPGSGLGRLAVTPYWAFCWAGGMALARHVTAHPGVVAGRRVLDFGAGGGLVAIAAARAGAREVTAVENDPYGRAAIALNAELNGVPVRVMDREPEADIVLAGDVFYAPEVAARSVTVLEGLAARGARVLVGDPGRRDLPVGRLSKIAGYEVPDADGRTVTGGVYAF